MLSCSPYQLLAGALRWKIASLRPQGFAVSWPRGEVTAEGLEFLSPAVSPHS